MNTPEGILWGNLYYDKEPIPRGPIYSLRDSYVIAMLWEMGFRRMKEKLSFALMIRESAMNIKKEGKSMETALDNYINAVAPFIETEEEERRKKIMEVLEEETRRPFRVTPVRMPSRKVLPFKRRKK